MDTVGVQQDPDEPTQNDAASIPDGSGSDGGDGGAGQCVVGSNTNSGALQFNNFQEFSTDDGNNKWILGQLEVQDQEAPDNLDQVKFEITDSSGTIRATSTLDISQSGGQYQQSGDRDFSLMIVHMMSKVGKHIH